MARLVPRPSSPPIPDSADFPRLSINGTAGSLGFNSKNQIGYRLYKRANLSDWKLWEDFGVISGDHDVTVPLNPEREREFHQLDVYQP